MRKFENRIIIVTRATRLEKVLESQNTLSQAKFYVKNLGGDFTEYEEEHTQYGASVRQAKGELDTVGNIQVLDRQYLSNFIFAPSDIIVVIGQDGLVANTMKYLDGQPVIGINPDAARWDGVLLPFTPENAARITEETIRGKRKFEEVTMARVRVQNGQELLAVNDFFIGQRTHTSARYILKHGGLREPQSSSGVIVSTGLGTTGWMKSIIAGANRISYSVIGRPYGSSQESEMLSEEDEEEMDMKMSNFILDDVASFNPARIRKGFKKLVQHKKEFGPSELSRIVGKWSSEELLFAVREPFPSKTTGTNLVFGKISPREPLRIESLMGENGVIFSDGIESDFIAFNSGTEAVISLSDKKGRIVV
jgi:NAD kinase